MECNTETSNQPLSVLTHMLCRVIRIVLGYCAVVRIQILVCGCLQKQLCCYSSHHMQNAQKMLRWSEKFDY